MEISAESNLVHSADQIHQFTLSWNHYQIWITHNENTNTDSVGDCRGVRICDKCYLGICAIVIQSRSLQREASKFVRFVRFVFLKIHSATLREIRAIRVP